MKETTISSMNNRDLEGIDAQNNESEQYNFDLFAID